MPRMEREIGTNDGAQAGGNGNGGLTVAVLYNDLRATLRAAYALTWLSSKFHSAADQSVQTIPVKDLEDTDGFASALTEASAADVVVISFNGAGGLPPILETWLEMFLLDKRDTNSAVVALMSAADPRDLAHSARYEFVEKMAKAAGLLHVGPVDADVDGHLVLSERIKNLILQEEGR
jgi:hypothetical protein